jgi:hypothetical protein
MVQANTTQASNGTLPAQTEIMQRTLQAFQQAGGPLPTATLKNRPWFQNHGVTGAPLGRAVSALVRNGKLQKAGAEGVYQIATGTPSSSTPKASTPRKARSTNGQNNMTMQNLTTTPLAAGSKSQTKRMASQSGQRANARQQSGKAQYAQQGRQARSMSQAQGQNANWSPSQGALIQRITQAEQQLQRLSQAVFGK